MDGEQETREREPLAGMVGGLVDAHDAVSVKDRSGRYLMVNEHAALIAGRQPGEMTGLTDTEIFGEPGAAVLENDLVLMERNEAEAVEEPVVLDGEMRTLLTTRTPLRDASGEVIGLVTVSSDVAELRRHEQELREREALLVEIQAIARVASWEWDCGEDAVTWSPEFYEMVGVRPGAIKPKLSGFLELIHPDDRPAAQRAVERALAGTDRYEAAHRLVRPDGAERMLLCRGRVIRDTDGTALRVVGASLDLTNYMWIANELRSSHDRLVEAERVARSGSFEWDIASDRVRWSEGMYKVFGLRHEEFSGTSEGYYQLVHPDDRASQREGVAELLESGERRAAIYRIRRADGAVRTIRSDAHLERTPSGMPRRLIGVLRDVTDE